ncbi:hypothetical protein Avbf_07948 [Armadillidium vulgare]|nr:hypothetical protein Avbf_07948 [Armadillidium vulgare]
MENFGVQDLPVSQEEQQERVDLGLQNTPFKTLRKKQLIQTY